MSRVRDGKKKKQARDPWSKCRVKTAINASQVIHTLKELPGQSANLRELNKALQLSTPQESKSLERLVRSLTEKGKLSLHRNRIGLPDEKTFIGTLIAHPDGYGFVQPDDKGSQKDGFLPRHEMRGLMHGDRLRVRIVQSRGRESVQVIETIQQANDTIIGQFLISAATGIVEPRSRRFPQSILIRKKDAGGAHDGDWVRIRLQRNTHPLRGTIVDILEDVQSPANLIDLIIAEQGLPGEFPDAVLAETDKIPDKVLAKDWKNRLDLTHLNFITIDGEDARDFDDAICIETRGAGFEAWIAIADVAHAVTSGSKLDEEAALRANSFYFSDRVIPMLPERLSNGICSMNPDVERLSMVVRIRYDAGGRRRAIHLFEAVIRSRARLTYTQASQWLEDGQQDAIADANIRDMLTDAHRLQLILERERKKRGALDLDMPEVRAVVEDNQVSAIQVCVRNTAQRLIEEMMLAANTAVARFIEDHKTTLLYRIHEPPKLMSITSLNEFLAPFDLHVPIRGTHPVKPGDVQYVLEQVQHKNLSPSVLHRLVLRSMQQAKYSPENAGHFGLAYPSYCHFTSPIRRYADLSIHRTLKAILHQTKADNTASLAAIGEITSTQERKQTRAEWDTQAMLGALYHSKDIGETFTAIISGMTERRIFLELVPTHAEASIDVSTLRGKFTLDKQSHRLTMRNGEAFQLGDTLHVRIVSTDPVRGLILVDLDDDCVTSHQHSS